MSRVQSACSLCLERVDVFDALSLVQNHSVELGLGVQQWTTAGQLPVRFRIGTRVLFDPLEYGRSAIRTQRCNYQIERIDGRNGIESTAGLVFESRKSLLTFA